MLVEMHILQNFAPSNLNRDDTGSPKDCEFGGYRRARISSQCLKRAMRTAFRDDQLLPPEQQATRTKRLVEAVAHSLAQRGRDEEQAKAAVEAALASIGIGIDARTNTTQYLLYLGSREINAITTACDSNWEALTAASGGASAAAGGRQSARDAKRAGREAVPPEVGKALSGALDGGRAADLALFGRMVADLPERNIDAACQVAHALSTHQVSVEFDYYTAVDDLKPDDTAGADMIGTVEFNSACFYRYANVDLRQLQKNLGGDAELARDALKAFLRAAVTAVPSGKQNSMAAHNPPSLIMTVTRRSIPWSLANAFVRPVRAGDSGDLVKSSTAALDAYWARLEGLYGAAASGITNICLATLDGDGLHALKSYQVPTLSELVDQAVASGFDGVPAGAVS